MMANRKVKGEIMCDRGGHGVKSPGCALSCHLYYTENIVKVFFPMLVIYYSRTTE